MKRIPSNSLRVGLTLALLAGLAVTTLNLSLLRSKITTLQNHLVAQTSARVAAENELSKTKGVLAATTDTLQVTKAALTTMTIEREDALATVTSERKRSAKLTEDLAAALKQRNDAQDYLARYQGTGMEPEQVLAAAKELKTLRKDLSIAQKENGMLTQKVKILLADREDSGTPIALPADLKARVIAADPKWHFVVLDAGENQGVLERAEILVSRNGHLVGKARVIRVQKDRCIADLVPGWEFGAVAEGDVAIPALPRS